MNVSDFDFDLPEALIAQEAAERGASRLLVLRRDTGAVEHAMFSGLERFLRRGDLLVLNDTKVFPGRLLGQRAGTGGGVECLLMEQPRLVVLASEQGSSSSLEHGAQECDVMVRKGTKWPRGTRMRFERDGLVLHGEFVDPQRGGRRTLRLWTEDSAGVTALLDRIGHIPLPPYIKRGDRVDDRERYQTVYAAARGSIAAPTAGLHFTEGQLASLRAAGVEQARVTLHVGYGTFKPVRVERVEDHEVDPEAYTVTAEAAAALTRARREGRRVVAVGTTTVRVLESLEVSADGDVRPRSGDTRLFIRPGHQFRLVDALITNFHLPKSSLLMLVAAFAGREPVLAAYREAVERGYRFYSYGDAMLIA